MGSSALGENEYKIPRDHANTSPNQWKLDKEEDPRRRPRAEPRGKRERPRTWSYSSPQRHSSWDMWTHTCAHVCACGHTCAQVPKYAVMIGGAKEGPARGTCPFEARVSDH